VTLDALRDLGGEAQRKRIREWALTHGKFSAREMAAAPPEAAAHKYKSAVDHALSWALTDLKKDGLLENPSWSTWKLTSAALSLSTSAVEEPVDGERLAELRAMPYPVYLRTPEWKRIRTAALLRAGYACSMDVKHTERLEVHHRSYEHLGAEPASDLVVLCHSCHRLYHDEYGRPRRERQASSPRRRPRKNRSAAGLTVESSKPRIWYLLRRLFAG
jgi:hypothetical protein